MDHFCVCGILLSIFWERHLSDGISVKSEEKIDDYCGEEREIFATGTIYELHKAGYRVLALECARPTAIRREVAFSEAVYDGVKEVEGVTARKITSVEEVATVWEKGEIPVLIDAEGKSIEALRPLAVADLILAKKNLGTRQDMAPLVIGAGPGFAAGEDVDVVIETMRGYEPGKAIYQGSALENTGIPGNGRADMRKERVIHSPAEGVLRQKHHIEKSCKEEA
ncbi:MAG: selenium-dependent molybdenum cofactor biosynthesis protein YqeB [Coprococcus sp.]